MANKDKKQFRGTKLQREHLLAMSQSETGGLSTWCMHDDVMRAWNGLRRRGLVTTENREFPVVVCHITDKGRAFIEAGEKDNAD